MRWIYLLLFLRTGSSSPHALVHMGALLSPSGPFLHSTLLDGLPVARCKPEKEILGPTQPWVSAALGTEDWERGDRMCREEKARFMETLLQLGDPPGVASVLQKRRGCVLEDDGRVTVFDDYGHNGEDLDNSSLTDSSPATGSVKDKRECVALLKKLLKHRKNRQVHPKVFVFVKKEKHTQMPYFSCLATGFEFKVPEVRLYRHRQEVTMGVWSSGVRPNGDGNFQLRKSVEITEEEGQEYYCSVTEGNFTSTWRLEPGPSSPPHPPAQPHHTESGSGSPSPPPAHPRQADSGSEDQPDSQTQPQQTDAHSLVNINTAFSRPGQRPYFSHSMLLDGAPVIRRDKDMEIHLPMQQWVLDALNTEDWEARDMIYEEEKAVFRELIKRLKDRRRGWVLQRRRGCMLEDDGRVTVFDHYGYNGEDMDDSMLTDISLTSVRIKDRRECVALLKKLLKRRKKRQVHPEVFVFVKMGKFTQLPYFSCLTTGFEFEAPKVRLYRKRQEVTRGVWSSGVRPNGDGTFQLRKSVEITEEEGQEYHCRVTQGSFSETRRLAENSSLYVLTVSLCVGGGVAVVILCVFRSHTPQQELSTASEAEENQSHDLFRNNFARGVDTTPLHLTFMPAIEYKDVNSIRFKETDQLGHGRFGEVCRGQYQGTTVAVKKMPVEDHFFEHEILMCQNLSHPNIVHFIAAAKTERFAFLVYEYIHGADLETILHKPTTTIQLTREDKSRIILDLAMAVEYIHSKHIIHQDIKPANVMVKAKTKQAFLIDWGISFFKDSMFLMQGRIINRYRGGTTYYMAPECLLTEAEATSQSDVWSLGLTFLQLHISASPWQIKSLDTLPKLMQKRKSPKNLKRLRKSDQKVIEPMLRYTPEQRPSAAEVVRSLQFTWRDWCQWW
ncbi:uncharacterized protein LOC136764658 isoform X2 [Amia ocellicauda]|uniref:uncharacterized protein LOC136764658 isoform X2 n=1 Tax=Amia ocellicauda TaxID=2972642 RepID=UPI003464AF31